MLSYPSNQEICVIFDLDGILADTKNFHLKAWKIFGENHSRPVSEDFFLEIFGMANQEIMPLFFNRKILPGEFELLAEEKESIFCRLIKGQIKPLPGVKELFEDLCRSGILTAVASSGPRKNVDFLIKELKLEKYLKAILTGDDILAGKPEPEIFLKAAKFCNVEPRNCLVIEDAPCGIQGAIKAGMAVLAVTNTYPGDKLKEAHLVINSLDKMNSQRVLDLVREINYSQH